MERTKVISAYLRGFITLKECEQILGIEASFIQVMVLNQLKQNSAIALQSANQ